MRISTSYLRLIYFLLLLPLSAVAQPGKKPAIPPMPPVDPRWKTADSLMARGLPQSALLVADELYTAAKKAKNDPQLLKAAMRRVVYRTNMAKDEDTYLALIQSLFDDIKTTTGPTKAVLQSVLAEVYWHYFQQNRYKFYDRTTVAPTPGSSAGVDPRTWDARQLQTTIASLYTASVADAPALQKTPITSFDAVIDLGNEAGRVLRPTLFDVLAHRAIDYFANTEPDVVRPINSFSANDPAYLAVPQVFADKVLPITNSLSGTYQALRLYQQLLVFHKNDPDPLAFAVNDVARLTLVRQRGTLPNETDLLRETLNTLTDTKAGNQREQIARAEYKLMLIELLAGADPSARPMGRGYNRAGNESEPAPNDSVRRQDRRRAAELARKLMVDLPETVPAQRAKSLLNSLLQPLLSVQLEEVNQPEQPFRARVSFRNVKKGYYKILAITADEARQLPEFTDYLNDPRRDAWFAKLQNHTVVVQEQVALPDDGDLHSHSTEIPVKGLAPGYYLFLVSNDGKWAKPSAETGEVVGISSFAVSNLSYVDAVPGYPNTTGTKSLYVLDRLTGQPLANVPVRLVVLNNGQNNGNLGNASMAGATYRTNAQGNVTIPRAQQPRNGSYLLRIGQNKDVLDTDAFYNYQNGYNPSPTETRRAVIFTDRAIYRPGQTIYWKVLLYTGLDNQFAVVPATKIPARFTDTNGEQVGMSTLTTNEFGTATGTFTAPVGRLTGQMTISTEWGSASVRVEDYKRPTFTVVADPLKQAVVLGQAVPVRATAKTLAGAVVSGAKVTYRVTRTYYQPYWGGDWWRPSRPVAEQEIANGTATTDADGVVSFSFTALPDPQIAASEKPQFTYSVTIDVTDPSGETRSTTQALRIGYTALTAELALPGSVLATDKKQYAIRLINAGGNAVGLKAGTVALSRLTPQRPGLRSQLWAKTDRPLLTREQYVAQFPLDLYADENNPATWTKTQVRTQPATAVSVAGLASGLYAAEINAQDSTGQQVQETVYFEVTDPRKPTPPARPGTFVQVERANAQPGEEAIFWVGTALATPTRPDRILMAVEEKGKIVREEWLTITGQPLRVALPVQEKHRGNFAVHFASVQNGRLLTDNQTVTVPFTNKQLPIETETFRDKLKPGQPEQWTLRIAGPQKDKVLAEMVATLYDGSLDAFDRLDWPTSFYGINYSQTNYWQSNNFGTRQTQQFWQKEQPDAAIDPRQMPRLDWGPYEYSSFRRRFIITNKGGNPSLFDDEQLLDESVEANYSVRGRGAAPMAKMSANADMLSENVMQTNVTSAAVTAPPANVPGVSGKAAVVPPLIRKNFNETAFFFPTLQTDSQGRVVLAFTIPEALTRWRLLMFAHTKDMQTGTLEREAVTQKELMVTTNVPRFLRENDTLRLTARIDNLSSKPLAGQVTLQLTDALTGEVLNQKLGLTTTTQAFQAKAGQSGLGVWTLTIPQLDSPVAIRVTAQAGAFTDGEERVVPVLPNRTLVTDTQPFWINGGEPARTFRLAPLADRRPNQPLNTERLTVEVTSNPAWYALQSLPFLMENTYESAEQLFSRLYANALGAHILNSRPQFRQVVDLWKQVPPKSPLEKNAELKAVVLENTPWLAEAKSETERTARLGQFFDQTNLANQQHRAIAQLLLLQDGSGGLTWFSGMRPNLTMSLHVLAGLGHLRKLGVALDPGTATSLNSLQTGLLRFVDAQIKQEMAEEKAPVSSPKQVLPAPYWAAQYLYARSFFLDVAPLEKAVETYLVPKLSTGWQQASLQTQALAASTLYRFNRPVEARAILQSLTERSLISDEMGMYWSDNQWGTYWYEAPVETQAYLIEAYEEAGQAGNAYAWYKKQPAYATDADQAFVDRMRQWLVQQKRTQSWSSSKATTEAIYALLLRGSDGSTTWLDTKAITTVLVGGQSVASRANQNEALTGYQKVTYAPTEVTPALGTLTVSKPAKTGPAWGAMYWQHFEPLDAITGSGRNLTVQKTLFRQRNTNAGPVLESITPQTPLKPGDLLQVRLTLTADRAMEYVHLKDGRAAGFEPVTAVSGAKYRNGLSYYEAPRDASTDFFMEAVSPGTYVFEYSLRVVHGGDFGSGLATVQCFYAPEFAAHSAGTRISVR